MMAMAESLGVGGSLFGFPSATFSLTRSPGIQRIPDATRTTPVAFMGPQVRITSIQHQLHEAVQFVSFSYSGDFRSIVR